MAKLSLYLCKNCIKDLEDYNPYVDEDGNAISIEDMEITEVDKKDCMNYTVDGEFLNLKEER